MRRPDRTTGPDDTPATDPDAPIDHDLIVVGGGVSGLAAAVFVARYGLDTLVLDGGRAAITQCAHIENYLGFPGGISPERFLELGRTQVKAAGGRITDARVESVRREDRCGFVVETADRELLAERVVVAAAYDEDVLKPVIEELAPGRDADASSAEEEAFAPTDGGRTDIEKLYVAGWMSDETVHQVGVSAGHGARVGLAVARDDMSDRYWPAVGARYVDWVVHEGRYGGDGWHDHVDEWFDREMLPADEDVDDELIDRAREDIKGEFLGRCICEEERRRRDRRGQRQLLEALDDDVIREYAARVEGGDD